MKKLKFSFWAMLLMLVLIVAGCSEESSEEPVDDGNTQEEAAERKVLNLNNTSEPGALHPGLGQGTHDSWVLEHAFEGLYKKDPEGNIVPGIATDHTVSDDGITWTFNLREDAKWSNGEPLTAHDFEFAWKYTLSPEAAADYAYQMYYLANGAAYNAGEVTADEVGVKALDDHTLEVKLEKPTLFFLDLITFYTYYPVSKAVQEANPNWYQEAETYVSNGAFKLTEWKHKESMKLEKNEFYHEADKINLDEVNFVILEEQNTEWQMYQTGELDLVNNLPSDVEGKLIAEKNPEVYSDLQLSVYYYNLNTDKKPLNNVKVRKALAMALNRQVITENVAQGGQPPAYSVIPPGVPDTKGDFSENSGQLFKEDVEEAKKLLEEGLKEEGLTGMPEFTILYNTSEGHKKIAEAAQEMWRQAFGFTVQLENVEFQVKLDREKAGEYDISRAGWVGDYIDPMTFLELWVTDGAYNDAKYSNPEYDALIQKSKEVLDPAERMTILHEAEELLISEMPIVPIYFYTETYAVKDYVTGIYTPLNRYPQFIYADVDMSKK